MDLTNFIIAVIGITTIHFVLSFLYSKITKLFPFVFGGNISTSHALYKNA